MVDHGLFSLLIPLAVPYEPYKPLEWIAMRAACAHYTRILFQGLGEGGSSRNGLVEMTCLQQVCEVSVLFKGGVCSLLNALSRLCGCVFGMPEEKCTAADAEYIQSSIVSYALKASLAEILVSLLHVSNGASHCGAKTYSRDEKTGTKRP